MIAGREPSATTTTENQTRAAAASQPSVANKTPNFAKKAVHMYVRMYVCMYACMCVELCMFVGTHKCVNTCMYR